ncbi:Alpha/Beta hydrolase protein [Sporodiniella umbellata]|nr:Alpha/Beta hydrolase protein [Sporodiniella umbellata]
MPQFFCKGLVVPASIFTILFYFLMLKQRNRVDSYTGQTQLNLKTLYRFDVSTRSLHYTPAPKQAPWHLIGAENQVKAVPGMVTRPVHKEIQRNKEFVRLFNTPVESYNVPYSLPDITDHATILTLSLMSYDAYIDAGDKNSWLDLDSEWKVNSTFGWTDSGMRGHVFGNEDNSLLIIGFKGTSGSIFNNEPTGEKDKYNDNMLFSCCCAKVDRFWSGVCKCKDEKQNYQCDSLCLEEGLTSSALYYDYANRVYLDVVRNFPDATIWLTGHSLGGAVASLVGQTFGVPTVTFESPGDRLASRRLHMPQAPGAKHLPIWHFGHTADPLFIGVCTGVMSGCYIAGYAMESRCHAGKVCVWDTVKDHGWRVNLATHRIGDVINNIIRKPEEFPLPTCQVQEDCDDCGLWVYNDPRD